MMLSMHLRQIFRKPMRTVLYLLILALLTAFFCVSLNLYDNSRQNIRLAQETYSTIAVMELYADVDSRGNLIADVSTAEDYAGYHDITVNGYDIKPIVTAPSVIKYELRARYGAYSDENIASAKNGKEAFSNYDVFRFKLVPEHQKVKEVDKPWDDVDFVDDGNYRLTYHDYVHRDRSEMSGAWGARIYNVDVIESATESFFFNELDFFIITYETNANKDLDYALSRLNGEGTPPNCIVIEPNTEYIISGYLGALGDEGKKTKDGKFKVDWLRYEDDRLFVNWYYRYRVGYDEYALYDWTDEQPFAIYRYEDVLANPELKEKFDQLARAYRINSRSFAVMTTNDISGVPAFHLGNMFMKKGRSITEEEYASGAKVCMISKELAKVQNWTIGDKIDFSFYELGFFTNATMWGSTLKPYYTYTDPNHFFDSGEYEVVGIYDVRPITGSSTVSRSALSVPWNTIYIPEKSLENAPAEEERPVTGALMTLCIENGKIEPFLERMNELGITGAKNGDYEARFTFYDQGYSRIQPSLEALSGTAELLLILSSSLLVIAALLLAFFYALSQKQSIGTMRLLGCSKARAAITVVLCAAMIAIVGVGVGAYVGHALTQRVGESIIASADTVPEEFQAFSAYLTENTNIEVEFALGAKNTVSAVAIAAALVLFMGGVIVCVLRYLGKEPRELLPRAGE